MKPMLLIFSFLLFLSSFSFSQNVGIGTSSPNTSSQLEVTSSSKGILIPRMTTSAVNAISNPAKGLIVFDSAKNQLMVNMGTAASKNWQTIVFKSGWSLEGNSGINPSGQFIGTTDNQPLRFRLNNIKAGELNSSTGNIFFGLRAGESNSTGFSSIAIGTDALKTSSDRSYNIAIGDSALFSNGQNLPGLDYLEARANIAIGSKTLYSNTNGCCNTAVGHSALYLSTTAAWNTAIGSHAMLSNTTGSNNTAIGGTALFSNTGGVGNAAAGSYVLYYNTNGSYNTAMGLDALFSGEGNNASFNTGVGGYALASTLNSQYNTALGYFAGAYQDNGYNNTFLGSYSDATQPNLYNCIAIGKSASCAGPSEAVIGNSFTGLIGGHVNWSVISDGRFKRNIHDNVKGLAFIMKLRPVTYQLDVNAISRKLNEDRGQAPDPSSRLAIAEKEKTFYTGFIAQEVNEAADLSGFDFSGVVKPRNENDFYRLRYAEFVVPLVKAVQEQQGQLEELKKNLKDQKEINALLQKQIDELKVLIKK